VNKELYNKALEVWQAGPNADNEYHNSTGFLSNSFIGDFLKCEYDAVIKYAKVQDSEIGFNEAFATGHLVEAICFEGEEGKNKMLERYKEDAYMKSGKPKAWVGHCIDYAESIMRHDNIERLLTSESSIYHRSIFFKLHGMPWRAELDYLNLNKHVEIDMKTTKAKFNDRSWNSETKTRDLTFIDEWNYHRQRAIYQHAVKLIYDEMVTPHILAVSKGNKSVRFFKFDNQDRLDYELKSLAPIVDSIKEVLDGEREPKQCESCVNCVESEVVDFVINASEYCAEVYT
jgi:hypothetical protein